MKRISFLSKEDIRSCGGERQRVVHKEMVSNAVSHMPIKQSYSLNVKRGTCMHIMVSSFVKACCLRWYLYIEHAAPKKLFFNDRSEKFFVLDCSVQVTGGYHNKSKVE